MSTLLCFEILFWVFSVGARQYTGGEEEGGKNNPFQVPIQDAQLFLASCLLKRPCFALAEALFLPPK